MGKRQESRDRIESQILEVGRRQLVTDGPAALSLRAVARELGLVSSAVYRYVANRDELLTLLLIDAYSELADAVDAARGAECWRAELRAMAHAARSWAVSQPARWALLYGTPVPGYHAPAEQTVTPGTRVVGAMFSVIADGTAAGAIPASKLSVTQPLSADFDDLREEFAFVGDDCALARGFLVWATVVGAISLEVFGQYGAGTFTEPRAVFDVQIDLLVESLTR